MQMTLVVTSEYRFERIEFYVDINNVKQITYFKMDNLPDFQILIGLRILLSLCYGSSRLSVCHFFLTLHPNQI